MLGFSYIVWPLFQVTKSGEKEIVCSSKSQKKEFDELEHQLFFAPVLTLPYLQYPFEIEIDAFLYAIGVVLI